MKTRKMLIGVCVVLLSVALATQSLAWWGGGDKAKKIEPEKRMERIAEKLDLTEEQKEKFKALVEEQKEEKKVKMKAKREKSEERKAEGEKIKDLAKKMKEELRKDAPDRNKIHGYIKQMSEIRTGMQIKRIDSLLELRKSLTPEQKEKFKKMTHTGKKRLPKAEAGKRGRKRK